MEKTLVQQNPQWSGRPFAGLADRAIMAHLIAREQLPHIQILTGVRRCGKSTVFRLLMNKLMADGINPKSILNINLDAPVFIPLWNDAGRLREVVETAERLTGERVRYLFLDEVQQVRDWEVFVKAAYDACTYKKIYVTGSNSNLLAGRFSSMLSGRYLAAEVRPMSLSEILATIGIRSALDGYEALPQVQRRVASVLRYGAFPEIVLSDMEEDIKAELLHSYFESIVQKDCILYNSIRDAQLFYRCSNYLLQNAGNRFSLQQLGRAVGSNENTMNAYLGYLCQSYILADTRNFSFSQKETKRSEHKCYCIDNGLIKANTTSHSPDTGRYFENLVYNELAGKGYRDISFAGGQGECDFIAWKDGDPHAFQACYELTDANRQRETAGFNVPAVQARTKTIITYAQTATDGDIRITPLWEWAIDKH